MNTPQRHETRGALAAPEASAASTASQVLPSPDRPDGPDGPDASRARSDEALAAFVAALASALDDASFVRLLLAKPSARAAGALRIDIRIVALQGERRLSLTITQATRDLTRNLGFDAGLAEVRQLLRDGAFGHARLDTAESTLELLTSRKGRRTLMRRRAAHALPADAQTHDRVKRRHVELDRPYLAALGVTDAEGRLVPAMARKWKQIDKFVELLDGALAEAGLKTPRGDPPGPLDLVDFGAGKGYLTFAAHDHLHRTLGLPTRVLGVELRADLVDLCNAAARRLDADGLRFEQGDVRTVVPPSIDVMIALHACDTATDHAIATGVSAGARVIMCSPCCHKELRPQLLSPHPLRPILKHGVHLGQTAEMLTDGLRALLLDACGYDARVFEFVALEHTNKNKMILAVRRPAASGEAVARRAVEAGEQIDAIKRFYGIREQCLERLLQDRLAAAGVGGLTGDLLVSTAVA